MLDQAYTLDEVLRWASQITGKGVNSEREELTDLIREALDVLNNEESLETLRRWCIPAYGRIFSVPKELRHPLKYKIGTKVKPVRDRTYAFKGFERKDCCDYRTDLIYIGESPLFFPLPSCGARVAVRSSDSFECDKGKEPYILFQGKDVNGHEIYRTYGDTQDIGERVYIAQPNQTPTYSLSNFKSISSAKIFNASLNLQVMWCKADTLGAAPTDLGLLALYDPGDIMPVFRQYQFSPSYGSACDCVEIEVLGHLSVPNLKHNNELIRGFDSSAIRSMIRALYHQDKNDIQSAAFNSRIAMTSIKKRNKKKQPETDAITVDPATSAGSFPRTF